MRVGFIGLGHMGGPMSERVARAGFEVTAFDLRREAVEAAVRRVHVRGVLADDVALHPGPEEAVRDVVLRLARAHARAAADAARGVDEERPAVALPVVLRGAVRAPRACARILEARRPDVVLGGYGDF